MSFLLLLLSMFVSSSPSPYDYVQYISIFYYTFSGENKKKQRNFNRNSQWKSHLIHPKSPSQYIVLSQMLSLLTFQCCTKPLSSYNSFHSAKKNKNSVRSQFTSINPYYSDGCIFIYRILAQANKKQIIRIFFSFGWELSQLRTEEAWKMENCSCSRICICWSLLWFFCISCVISYRIPTVVVRSYFE